MESIESLNMALELYQGTLIFVSHDREFVSSLATRVIEITPERVVDFSGNYDDYLRSKGIESNTDARWRCAYRAYVSRRVDLVRRVRPDKGHTAVERAGLYDRQTSIPNARLP